MAFWTFRGHYGGFKDILVILEVLELFWSFVGFNGIFNHFGGFDGHFGHFIGLGIFFGNFREF